MIMTPKEKAIELVERFTDLDNQQINNPVNCALNCVDEILKGYDLLEFYPEHLMEYWSKVIIEIDNN